YCTLQSTRIFQNKILTGQWGILFVLAVCSIPASLAIVMLSRRLSKKVRSINKLLSEDEDAAYNLETIETGIRTLVESNREINQESVVLRRTRFISNFVRAEYTNRKAVIRAGEKADLHIERDYFVVLLMGDRGNSNENKAHEMMLGEIVIRENEEGFGIHLIQNNQSLFVIFGDDVTSMQTLLDRFFVIGKEYCEEFVMSASGIHEQFETSSEAYLEAAAAFDNRLLVDNDSIIYFKDVANREQVELLPDTYLQRLKNAIRSNEEAEAMLIIEEICNRMRSSRQSLLTFRIFYNDIIHMLLTEFNTNRADFGNIYNVFALSQCLSIQDFKDILDDVCHKLMNGRAAIASDQVDIASEAIQSMKQNYQNPDFNMSALAETLGISGVTLAVEFKSSMGISPSDYLAIIRMERAKVLLKESQLRIKEVSVSVGYEDDHVFMRRFKKYVGKTPGEYRKEEG
ncbi:MAG: AraC family transcriptional regulator, partial [Hungatella sp.]